MKTIKKELTLILKDFDKNKNADMKNYINSIMIIFEKYKKSSLKLEKEEKFKKAIALLDKICEQN